MKVLVEFFEDGKAKSIEISNEEIQEMVRAKLAEDFSGEIELDRFNFLVDFK